MRNVWLVVLILLGTKSFAGTGGYSVPLQAGNQDLREYAWFPLNDAHVERVGEDISVMYTLPLELTGAPNHIRFSGKVAPGGGAMKLQSNNGKLECANDQITSCLATYTYLNIDRAARETVLRAISHDEVEFEKRMLVASRFADGGEPHGLLSIDE